MEPVHTEGGREAGEWEGKIPMPRLLVITFTQLKSRVSNPDHRVFLIFGIFVYAMLPPWIDWLVVAKIETIWRPTRWRFSLKCSFLDFLDFLARIHVCMFIVLRTFFFVSSFRNIDMYICIIIYISFCLFVYDTYNNIRYTLIHCIYITRYIYSLNIYNLFII